MFSLFETIVNGNVTFAYIMTFHCTSKFGEKIKVLKHNLGSDDTPLEQYTFEFHEFPVTVQF